MSTKKTSIAAIIFVTVYFMFIVFISLFKGLNFYNVKFNNIKIKHLFIKIDKKIILRANSITIIPQQTVKKDITSVYSKLYLGSKINKLFQELSLTNIKYKKVKIPLIIYKNNYLIINSNLLNISGIIKPLKKSLIIKNVSLTFKNKSLNNLNGKIVFDKKIKIYLTGKYETSKFSAKGYLNDKDIFYLNFDSNKGYLTYNDNYVQYKNLTASLLYAIDYGDYNINVSSSKINASIKSHYLEISDLILSINPKKIAFYLKDAYSKKLQKLKNIYVKNLKGTYFLKDKMLIISKNSLFKFDIDKAKINLKNNQLIFVSLNNLNLHTALIKLNYKNNILTAKNAIIIKFEKFLIYQINNTLLKNSFAKIASNIIFGHNNLLEIPNTKGEIKQIPIEIINFLANIKTKKALIQKAYINNIKISPIKFSFHKNIISISAKSNDIFLNNNLKQILNKFHYNIPLLQLKGKNLIKADFSYNLKTKKYHFNADINSTDSIFQYEKYFFTYKNLYAKIKDFNSTSYIKDFQTTTNYAKLILSSKIITTKKYLNAYPTIQKLKVLNLIKMKNYKERMVWDFANNTIFLLNSKIIIDLKNKALYFLELKNLIRYTPFYKIITGGGIYIKLYKNYVDIISTALLKNPLILNKKNPRILNANITVTKNKITVTNNYLNFTINNLTDFKAHINNADLSVSEMINIFDTIAPLTESNSTAKENNITMIITSHNTNFIYKKHKFLSQNAKITYKHDNLHIFSKYKKSYLKGFTKEGYFLLSGHNYSKEELLPLLDIFKSFNNINLDFVLVKSPDNFYTGKIYINSGVISKLKALNNIVAFINTIPALLSLHSPGFSAKGYKIKSGFINFLYYKNVLYLKQIYINGVNLAFKGKGYIDFNKNEIHLKLTAIMKMKLKKIPIIGKGLSYILFGKDGNLDVKIIVSGDINNPKVTQDLGKSILLSPFELFKRALTLPFHLF